MPEQAEKIVVALSSIPNTGKTTLFNRLTGSSQTTGNWPGVSVEKKLVVLPWENLKSAWLICRVPMPYHQSLKKKI